MKKIVFLILLSISSNLFAQNETKFYGIKLGEKSVINQQNLYFEVNAGKLMVTFFWIDYKIKNVNPREINMENSGFHLKLGNDTTLIFRADPKRASSMETDRGEILTMICPITKNQIKMINANLAKSIQLFFNKDIYKFQSSHTLSFSS